MKYFKSSKKLIKNSILYGFLAGIVYGLATVIYEYIKSSRTPGVHEIYIQLIIIFLYGILIALLGLIIGIIIAVLFKTEE